MLGFGISQWAKHVTPGGGPTVGRSTSGQGSGTNTYSLGFSPAPIAGTWLVTTGINGSGNGVFSISGGTNAWTELNTGDTDKRSFVHLCAAGEPTSYTVTIDVSMDDGGCCAMTEILGANSSNPDASTANATTTTGTQPTATSSNANDLAVLLNSNEELFITYTAPPTGYTQQVTVGMPISTTIGDVFIATKTNVGSGTITPGSWTITGSPSETETKLWTVLFKP